MKKQQSAHIVLCVLVLLALAGCSDGGHARHGDQTHPPAEAPVEPAANATETGEVPPEVIAGEFTHSVRCGCAVDGVGKCGNYIEIAGELLELELPKDADLGEMPFCGEEELTANVEGTKQDGKFVATSFTYTE